MATVTTRPGTLDLPATDQHRAIDEAAEVFAAELAHWRRARGLSKKQLALRMRFDPSYISHIECGRHRPTADFARRAESVLLAGGSLWERFEAYHRLRRTAIDYRPAGPPPWLPPTAGLVVERELTTLRFDAGRYHCTVRRELYNAGTDPVSRFAVRVGVDRWPDDAERSRTHHLDHPITFADLQLHAHCIVGGRQEAMQWQAHQDRDVLKEAWLLFRNADREFPLAPGMRATLEHTLTVSDTQSGCWIQRTIRLPTGRLTLELDFPGTPTVWGTETSPITAPAPLSLHTTRAGGRTRFQAVAENPPLQALYRLQWRFDGPQIPRPRVTPP